MPPKATLPTRMKSQWKAHIISAISIKFLQELTTINGINKIFICYDFKKYILDCLSRKFSIQTFSSHNFSASAPLDQEQYPPQP